MKLVVLTRLCAVGIVSGVIVKGLHRLRGVHMRHGEKIVRVLERCLEALRADDRVPLADGDGEPGGSCLEMNPEGISCRQKMTLYL